jgi:hypothetical protein
MQQLLVYGHASVAQGSFHWPAHQMCNEHGNNMCDGVIQHFQRFDQGVVTVEHDTNIATKRKKLLT